MSSTVNAERKQSVGVLVIYNLKEEDVRIDSDLLKLLGVEQKPRVRPKHLELGHT